MDSRARSKVANPFDPYEIATPPNPLGLVDPSSPDGTDLATKFRAPAPGLNDFVHMFGGPAGAAGLLDQRTFPRRALVDPGPWNKDSGRGWFAKPAQAQAEADPDQFMGPIPGYPEDGSHAWRKANDQTFLAAANRYNRANGLKPGNPGYWTGLRLKAQAMVESGGSPAAFAADPLQVNKPRDNADDKMRLLGLTLGQAMTPEISADAALKWLQRKGWPHDATGHSDGWIGDDQALRGYNGGKYLTDGVEHRDWYARQVLELERQALHDGGAKAGGAQ